MAELLLKVDPSRLTANEIAGQVVEVREDGFGWSELERKLFVIARVPLEVEEARATFLKSGVPDALLEAESATFRALAAAMAAKDEGAIEAAKKAQIAARYDASRYPARARHIDAGALPAKALEAVAAARAALSGAQADVDAAGRSALDAAALQERAFVGAEDVIAEVPSKGVKDAVERLGGDAAVDRLHAAERTAQAAVLRPVLDAVEAHPVVDLDAEALKTAVVVREAL